MQERETWGTREMWGMLFLGKVAKNYGECPQIFRGMFPNIPGNIAKHSEEYPQTFRGMFPNIPVNVLKHSRECPQTFLGTSPNVLKHSEDNVGKHSRECPQTIKKVLENMLGHIVKHPVESIKAFRRMYIIVLDSGYHELWPIYWKTVTVKFYYVLGNWKLWLIFQKRNEPKERNREKKSLMMKVWWLIFRSWHTTSWYTKQDGANNLSQVFLLIPLLIPP